MAEAALAYAHELPADWRARLRSRLLAVPDHDPEHSRFGGVSQDSTDLLRRQLRGGLPSTLAAAAVLVPIIERPDEPTLLLTVRASHLSRHAGQISFPGGRLEAGDTDLAAAALRETEEEIGIQAAFIEAVGFLPDHVVQTGYRVTPVVALLQPGFIVRSDTTEVAEVFELPLSVALVRSNYRLARRLVREVEVSSWELNYDGHQIWGLTCGMLMTLAERMGGGDA